jgi:alanine racemase
VRAASIDLDALARNIRTLIDALGVDQPLVDLRASAYGHGLVPVARASVDVGVHALRVSTTVDTARLRDAGVTGEILSPGDVSAARDLGPGVYGLDTDPASGTTAVMTLSAEVIAVKRVSEGTGVSYGYTYRAPVDTRIALVSIGYADGLPRLGSNTASAALGGIVHPVVGRIAMDQLVLDVGASEVSVGDVVTVFGDGSRGVPTALDWALSTRRPAPALTAGLGGRVVRTYP